LALLRPGTVLPVASSTYSLKHLTQRSTETMTSILNLQKLTAETKAAHDRASLSITSCDSSSCHG
jgi:hypothetical protein